MGRKTHLLGRVGRWFWFWCVFEGLADEERADPGSQRGRSVGNDETGGDRPENRINDVLVPSVACSMKDLNEVDMYFAQELVCERTGEQIDDGLVPRVTKEILEAIKRLIHQEFISERTGEQMEDGVVPRVTKEVLEEISNIPSGVFPNAPRHDKSMCFTPQVMEQRVEVVRLIPRAHSTTHCGGDDACARTRDPGADRGSCQGAAYHEGDR